MTLCKYDVKQKYHQVSLTRSNKYTSRTKQLNNISKRVLIHRSANVNPIEPRDALPLFCVNIESISLDNVNFWSTIHEVKGGNMTRFFYCIGFPFRDRGFAVFDNVTV